jgi:hypothetical protein
VPYLIKQKGTSAIADNAITTPKIADSAVTGPKIADGAITSTKPAESFMKRVQVNDDSDGHTVGWDPDGIKTFFTITDADVFGFNEAFISVTIASGNDINYLCNTVDHESPSDLRNTFQINCSSAPVNGEILHYLLVNLPENIV